MKKLKRLLKILRLPIFLLCLLAIFLFLGLSTKSVTVPQARLDREIENLKSRTSKIEIAYNAFCSPYKPVIYTLVNGDVNSFWKCLRLIHPKKENYCKCPGNPVFQFYSGNELLDTFTFHHDQYIRWKKFSMGNLIIPSDSQKKLKEFFSLHKIHNIEEPRDN